MNGDDRDEILVYLLGSFFCGTGGCNLLLFTDAGTGYALVNSFAISRLPVFVSNERTAGWHDLVRLESGGGMPATYVRHVFDGEKCVEQERVPADTAPEGRRYLAGELTFSDGIPLEPPGGDAKVAGTDFHATGRVPCSMEEGQPTATCPFGVTREGGGSGMVTVTKPDGRTRVIFFESGRATGYDMSEADPGEFRASREGDRTIVRIGTERYEIPDAVILGG